MFQPHVNDIEESKGVVSYMWLVIFAILSERQELGVRIRLKKSIFQIPLKEHDHSLWSLVRLQFSTTLLLPIYICHVFTFRSKATDSFSIPLVRDKKVIRKRKRETKKKKKGAKDALPQDLSVFE